MRLSDEGGPRQGTLVLQLYLLTLQDLQPLLHLETVIQSPSMLLGMYLPKDDVLPETALFDVLVPSRSEWLSCQLRL